MAASPAAPGPSKLLLGNSADIALDRDARVTLSLVLQPPSASAKPSTWLLVHTIPVTASLTTVLGRLAEAQASAVAAAVQGVSEESDSHAPAPTAAASTSALPEHGVEFARVGYVVSEIHAYCLLLKCSSPVQAAALKAALERGAEMGTATPVELVRDDDVTLRIRRDARDGVAGAAPSCVRLPLSEAALYGLRGREGEEGGGRGLLAQTTTPSRRLHPPRPPAPRGAPASLSAGDEHCPICQVEPLAAHPCLVTLCQHTYHLTCYARLASAECPLCRFSLYSLLSDARCEACGTYEDLWSCLICGYVGCGRGRLGHQHAHYSETGHSTALHGSTNRIWSERSRMFLNQEVALVLDACEGGPQAGGDTTPPRVDVAADALWALSGAAADVQDAELQAALTQSREEAVQDYYERTLRELLEEQERWYAVQGEALCAEVAHRRAAREAAVRRQAIREATDPLMRAVGDRGKPPLIAQLAALPLGERAARRAVAAAYADGARQILGELTRTTRGLVGHQRQRREELQEQALLLSHRTNGLRGRLARLRARISEAEKRGATDLAAKQEQLRLLEEQVAKALSHLTA